MDLARPASLPGLRVLTEVRMSQDVAARPGDAASKAELTGEVLFDRFSRGRYATDASHYQIMPVGVVAPRTIEEARIGRLRSRGTKA